MRSTTSEQVTNGSRLSSPAMGLSRDPVRRVHFVFGHLPGWCASEFVLMFHLPPSVVLRQRRIHNPQPHDLSSQGIVSDPEWHSPV